MREIAAHADAFGIGFLGRAVARALVAKVGMAIDEITDRCSRRRVTNGLGALAAKVGGRVPLFGAFDIAKVERHHAIGRRRSAEVGHRRAVDARRDAGKHVIDRPRAVRFDAAAELIIRPVGRWRSAFIFQTPIECAHRPRSVSLL